VPPPQLHFDQWLPFPVETVFLFFANPENLPRIMPPQTETRLVDLRLVPPPGAPTAGPPLAGVGSQIVTSFRPSPYLFVRAEWIAEITEFEWNHHFADEQRRGPFQFFRHRHEFTAESRGGIDGTVIRDFITYEVGFGALGALADKIFVRRQLRQTFRYRQQALTAILGEAGSSPSNRDGNELT
jgi:ligand-binding SRPBCC domain-containing protein